MLQLCCLTVPVSTMSTCTAALMEQLLIGVGVLPTFHALPSRFFVYKTVLTLHVQQVPPCFLLTTALSTFFLEPVMGKLL